MISIKKKCSVFEERSIDSKHHFICCKHSPALLSHTRKPFSFSLIDTSVWTSSTCLRQEVLLSASYPGRDPWSQPQIFPRWHLYWRTHLVVGQMFLVQEIQEQCKWTFLSKAQDTKRVRRWKPILHSQHNLAVVTVQKRTCLNTSEKRMNNYDKLWKKLKVLQELDHQSYCYTDNFLSRDRCNSCTHLQVTMAFDINSSLNYKGTDIMKSSYSYNPKHSAYCSSIMTCPNQTF